jgi:hypothetical protein
MKKISLKMKSGKALFCTVLCFQFASCGWLGALNRPDDVVPDDTVVIEDTAFYHPAEKGPYSFSREQSDSVLPSYMKDVQFFNVRVPETKSNTQLPLIILEPGFFASTTALDDVADFYASHGFIVFCVSNVSQFDLITTSINVYALTLLQMIRYAIEISRDSSNKLFNRIDTSRIGITGHSMAGGGTLMVCDSVTNSFNKYIKSAVAMNPFGNVSGPDIRMPILIIASEKDSTVNPFMHGVSASPTSIYASYESLPQGTVKAFANFKDMNHNAVADFNIFLPTSGNANLFLPTMLSWFKVYLTGNSKYEAYLDPEKAEFSSLESRFITVGNIPGYVYQK